MAKKKVYTEVEIMPVNSNVSYAPDSADEYAAVVEQALEGQDLRFHSTTADGTGLTIIPYENVGEVLATYGIQDVTLPTDTICGGEAHGRLVVTPNEPIGDINLHNDDGCYVTPPSLYSGVTATFDGVPLTEQQMWQGMRVEVPGTTDGKLAVDCNATSVTYTVVYTYEGETCNVTVTQNITLSDG